MRFYDLADRLHTFCVRARLPYRAAVCSLSVCLLFLSFAVRAADIFSPESLERLALSALISRFPDGGPDPVSGISGVEKPQDNLLYDGEIFYIDAPKEDEKIPESDGSLPICRLDLSDGALKLRNTETSFTPDLHALLEAPYPEISATDGPVVLILHTHGTESYSQNGESYQADTPFRTQDSSQNVVAVGRVLADELNLRGIETLHCEIMHDAEDYNSSYALARRSIEDYLEKYPSIRYIIDLHRDAIIRSDQSMVAPAIDTPDGRAAQVMLVVGTDAYGADHPDWQDNLNIACKLQSRLNAEFSLARPINLRGASFNEQFRAGSMLLEVGSCGNTLEEAKTAVRLFAAAFADMLAEFDPAAFG